MNSSMKKVLFVINTLGGAGAEKALLELLKKRGHADVIITGTEKCEKTAEYADNIYSINIEK